MPATHASSDRPSGFTLPELLVVIGLLAVLGTLVAFYVTPSFSDNKNVIRGVDRVTTTLLIAKQRALRDQSLRGVRLIVGANNLVRELQYIEQPEPFTGGVLTGISGDKVATFTGVDFIASGDPNNKATWNVAPNDYFRLTSPANVVRISDVLSATTLRLAPHMPNIQTNPPPPGTWQIIRKPRPITGEDTVALPENVVIDIGRSKEVVATPSIGADILFDPAGGVQNTASGTIVLWVRDATIEDPLVERERSRLLSINPRTGLIAAHEIGPANNPLQFATDGRSSGL